ncbi:TetR/AcrR family transcriptional regulator [Actinocatenispora comari]|jgi:AcrR family transcriptional regulator|uniref:TetR family transcriptional regulator n=1 Tax=Actinocatenispora comari TaxID=2807577 RepID=A0A8J4EN93_9ACTN|nr:TetR/AcrR family transcriptional regulator [Actinocatenispora comari]GIL27459.1 TetR family transcriptional regulator [Actinocatenispora comari]
MQVTDGRSLAAQARRAQIVDAAIEVIAAAGFAQCSFGRIAKHAGLSSTRLISYHFEDKNELIQAVVDTVLGEATRYVQPRIAATADRRAALAAYITANLEFLHDHPTRIRALVEIFAGARNDDRLTTSDTPRAVAIDFFRAGQREGVFRRFDPEVMATVLRAAIDAVAMQPDVDHAAYTGELVELFDRVTRADPAPGDAPRLTPAGSGDEPRHPRRAADRGTERTDR